MITKDHKGFLLLHLSVFIAGFTGVLGRLIELDPVVLVLHRMTWAAALMALFLLLRKEMRHFRFKDMARMGGVGVLLCLHWIFFYASIKASNVSIGVVCFSLVGFFTALLEPIINRHRFSVREFLFSILTVCGVYLIFQFDTRYRLGIALGIVSSALYALFAIANQHVGKHYEAKNMLFWEMVGGIVVLSVILPVYNAFLPIGKFLPAGLDYPYMAFMVVVCTIGLCLLQIIVLQKIDAFTVNLFVLGIALIIVSVVLQTWSKVRVKG